MKIQITFPQTVFVTKTIDIKEDHYEELMDASIQGQACFVYNQLTPEEQDKCPHTAFSIARMMQLGYCPFPHAIIEHAHQL